MLTGEKFANYLMKKEGFNPFQVKKSKINSMFRYSRGMPTVFLLKKHTDESIKAIDVAAHEVGHAVDLRHKEKYNAQMNYIYLYIITNLLVVFFSYLFLIPAIVFALICSFIYIKSELNADKNKRRLIAKHINEALDEYGDDRDPSLFMNEVKRNERSEIIGCYRVGIFIFIVAPFVLHFTEYIKGY
jgi:uncharacterized membrane protein YciS (DUF1049 family)